MKQNEIVSTKKKLSPSQLKVVPVILATESISAAAKKSKIGLATINRWLKQPLFKSTIEEKRQELFEAGLNRLKAATETAAIKMIELLDCKDDNIRRLTAKDILTFALKALESLDLEDRIEQIEEILEKRLIS